MSFDPTRLKTLVLPALLGVSAVAAWGVVGVGLLVGLIRPDLWVVERVEFEGHERSSASSLRHLAELQNGTTMWGADLAQVRDGVERHPWVRSAEVTLQWPSSVRVTITEHEPVAVLVADSMSYLNAEGQAFAPAEMSDINYPLITGIDAEAAALHKDVPARATAAALELLEALEVETQIPADRISEIHFRADRGFTVHISNGARILFDHGEFHRQLARLEQLEAQGVSPLAPFHIDLAPQTVAIVRPLGLEVSGVEG